jgi:integrase
MSNINLLKDIQVKQAKPKEKAYFLNDGSGLRLNVTVDNKKIWEFRYTLNGKRRITTFQTYPKISLIQARKKRDEYNDLIFSNIDPIDYIKEQKEKLAIEDKSDFKNIFYNWWEKEENRSAKAQHEWKKVRFENDVLPHIGNKKIKDIKIQDIVETLINKSKTSPETANRLFSYLKSIYSFAILQGYIDKNILLEVNKNHFLVTQKVKHFPKITDIENLKDLVNNIYNYKGHYSVKNALKTVLYLPLRATNLCSLKWEYIDFDNKILTIPRKLMKVKDKNLDDFKLPLSAESIEILKSQYELTNHSEWVFLGNSNKSPINNESPNKALKLMGFDDVENNRKISLHGFRGNYRSLIDTLDTDNKFSFEVKEYALDHQEKSKVVRAYTNKSDYTNQLRPLMSFWSGFIVGLLEN